MSAYVVSRTVEVSASGRRTVHTTAEAPTMQEALAMMQVIRMQDAGISAMAGDTARIGGKPTTGMTTAGSVGQSMTANRARGHHE